MATPPKKATLESKIPIGSGYDLYSFSLPKDSPLNFCGGQYIILNSGLDAGEEGKKLKRAYTIFSKDSDQNRFELLIRKVHQGRVSNHLSECQNGTDFEFSGPWGKFAGNETWPNSGKTLLFATDNGISSAISLISSGKFKERVDSTKLVWLLSEHEDPSLVDWIRAERIGNSTGVEFVPVRSTGDSWSVDSALSFARWLLNSGDSYSNFFLSGNGRILDEIASFLETKGIGRDTIGSESYFRQEAAKEDRTRTEV